MKSREEIIKSKDYWLTLIQNKIYAELIEHMEKNNLSQKEVARELNVSPSYISQVLNGNFNFTISKLIELALYVDKAPVFEFMEFDELLAEDSASTHKAALINDSSRYKSPSMKELVSDALPV